GPNRDGVVRGVRIATDWDTAPPRLVWRRRIGPAWSSVAVVGGRLFTQEPAGDFEARGCPDAATGPTVWSHPDALRPSGTPAAAPPRSPTAVFSHWAPRASSTVLMPAPAGASGRATSPPTPGPRSPCGASRAPPWSSGIG